MEIKFPADVVPWELGQVIFHKVAERKGMVTDIRFSMDGGVVFYVAWDTGASGEHYAGELTDQPSYAHQGGGNA